MLKTSTILYLNYMNQVINMDQSGTKHSKWLTLLVLSHYIVYAVPVSRPKNSPLSHPFSPSVPYNKLLQKSVTEHLVSSVSSKIPFILGRYNHNSLPEDIHFTGSDIKTEGAFKQDTHYSFVVFVFSSQKVANGIHIEDHQFNHSSISLSG